MTGKPRGKNGCIGHSKRKLARGLTGDDALCDGHAMRGQNVCRIHGGSSEKARAAGRRRIEAAEAREAVAKLGLETGIGKIDPRDALELELWRTHMNVHLYEALCAELSLAEGGVYVATQHANGHPTGDGKPHVLVVMRDQERKHLTFVAIAAARAGVEERRIEIEEGRARLVADLIREVVEDPELGLSRDKRQHALRTAATGLRVIVGGQAA